MPDLAKKLRGSLPQATIDARRLIMSAKNPSCVRLRAMLMAGVDPGKAVTQVFGVDVPSEQSQFALRQGNTFETTLYQNGAARLLAGLQDCGALGVADVRVLNLGQIAGLNSPKATTRHRAIQRAIAETNRAIISRATGDPNAPHVILQAHLRLPLGDGDEVVVRPDALYARETDITYRVAEVKSFPELHHLTDEHDVATTCAQAGVYAVALQEVATSLQILHPIAAEAALVFRRAGTMNPSVTIQQIARDIATARRMLEQRPRKLSEIAAMLGPGESLDQGRNLLRLPANFVGGCRSFCPLWQVCLDEARDAGRPAVLGANVEEIVAAVGTVERARQLMHGAQPLNDIERVVQRRLQAGLDHLQEAVA